MSSMRRKAVWAAGVRAVKHACCAALLGSAAFGVGAQGTPEAAQPSDAVAGPGAPQRSLADWLHRIQKASRVTSYSGSFVSTSADGEMSSVRIVHVCDNGEFLERAESLSGQPRVVYRQNQRVLSLYPQQQLALSASNRGRGAFPDILSGSRIDGLSAFYTLHPLGTDRVAGLSADVLMLRPRDAWRFAYRIWSEQGTGLMLKLQTLAQDGRVLEQVVFSELDLTPRVTLDELRQNMRQAEQYRLLHATRSESTPEAQGWRVRPAVPGFVLQGCFHQSLPGEPAVLQCAFSDGLATASLFFKPARREPQQKWAAGPVNGATQTVGRYVQQGGARWLVIGIGETPVTTLRALVNSVERLQ